MTTKKIYRIQRVANGFQLSIEYASGETITYPEAKGLQETASRAIDRIATTRRLLHRVRCLVYLEGKLITRAALQDIARGNCVV